MKNRYVFTLTCMAIFAFSACNRPNIASNEDTINWKVDSVLHLMTLEEKIGQLNHLQGNYNTTAYESGYNLDEEIRAGKVGAITVSGHMAAMIRWQKIAVEESRLKIPLLFATDVIHGYKTIFPVPLAMAASWDPDAIEKADSITAAEATSAGLHWTFAPMVDIARDPRWGRMMEGAGEDPYLGSVVAAAHVRGLQGDLGRHKLLACAKHFAAYGAVEGGREYNTVDISERVLREVYLPPFKAAVDAGVATVMNAFTVLDRIPASCNELLVKKILKTEWNFKGFTVSDAFSFYELIPHGIAADSSEAALLCMNAWSDMDLWARIYSTQLPGLVKRGEITEKQIDDAVRRVLYYKFKIGLFQNKYLNLDSTVMKKTLLKPAHLEYARRFARETLVLLKNENHVLPLSKDIQRIAVVGYLGNSRSNNDYMGNWACQGDRKDVVTLLEGIKQVVSDKTQIDYLQGCYAYGKTTDELIEKAVQGTKNDQLIILALGEEGYQSGECASRTNISLPGDQEKLVEAFYKTGKPIVGIIFAGRSMTFEQELNMMNAVLYVWQPGTMGGPAIADVLFNDYNPSGKLPVTIPKVLGQVPIYYNQLNTGRPRLGISDKRWGVSKWSDCDNEPLFPFGFGLSYTTFDYGVPVADKDQINFSDTLTVTIRIKNTGDYNGNEIVQLYTRDITGSVARPVKELKGFKKVFLKKDQAKTVEFNITSSDLAFWTKDMKYEAEPGDFELFVGKNSRDCQMVAFRLVR